MTINEIQTFLIDYYKGNFPQLRLGQAFLNKFDPSTINPDLFYCEDNTKATTMIIEKYLDKK